MRRVSILLAVVFLAQLAPSAWANRLPEKVGYTIYSRGEEVGHSNMTVTYEGDAIVFESNTVVNFSEHESLEMKSKTVADATTYLIRDFEFKGQRAGTNLEGYVEVFGDSLHGTVYRDDVERSDYRKNPFDAHLMLEDFVMSHEVLIALAHEASGTELKAPREYGIMFPSVLTMTKATVGFASVLEVESDFQAAVCNKLLVSIEGSDPYASYYDPKRMLPVYMAFPQTSVEVFLDDFYGDSPVSRYRD